MIVVTSQAAVVALRVLGHGHRFTHPFEQRVRLSTVHMDLGHDIELGLEAIAGADILHHIECLVVILIALVAKLVAVETKNTDPVSEFLRNSILYN